MRAPKIQWSETMIRTLAPKFGSRSEFSKAHSAGYKLARTIPGLLEEFFGESNKPWTREELVVEASKYQCKSAFRINSGGAYEACRNRFPGMLEDLFVDRIRHWKDEDAVRNELTKYTTRSESMRANSPCHSAALRKFPHLLDEVFGPPLHERHTVESATQKARGCSCRSEFSKKYGAAYQFMIREGVDIDALFPRMRERWDAEEKVRAEARKYATRGEFRAGAQRAYEFAQKLGIMNDLGFQPPNFGFKDHLPAYLYVADIFLTDGNAGVIIGITNKHPKYRYRKCERPLLTRRVWFLFQNGAEAAMAERHLKDTFKRYTVYPGDSPLIDKTGATGEILRGMSRDAVLSAIASLNVSCVEGEWN